MEVVDPARRPHVADPDLRLNRARTVEHADEPLADGPRVDDLARRAGPDHRAPATEESLRDGMDVETGQVAPDDQRRTGRVQSPPVRRPQARRSQLGDRLARPAGRAVVWRCRLVDRRREGLVGPPARVRLGLEEVVEALVAQAIDL